MCFPILKPYYKIESIYFLGIYEYSLFSDRTFVINNRNTMEMSLNGFLMKLFSETYFHRLIIIINGDDDVAGQMW